MNDFQGLKCIWDIELCVSKLAKTSPTVNRHVLHKICKYSFRLFHVHLWIFRKNMTFQLFWHVFTFKHFVEQININNKNCKIITFLKWLFHWVFWIKWPLLNQVHLLHFESSETLFQEKASSRRFSSKFIPRKTFWNVAHNLTTSPDYALI